MLDTTRSTCIPVISLLMTPNSLYSRRDPPVASQFAAQQLPRRTSFQSLAKVCLWQSVLSLPDSAARLLGPRVFLAQAQVPRQLLLT